jgi:hypothetical protein
VLSDFEALFGSFIDGDEQVLYLLIVDLQHGDTDLVLLILLLVVMYTPEDLLAADWHNALIGSIPDHGIGLARSRLAIGKQTAMIPLPRIIQNLDTDLLEDRFLVCVFLALGPE